MSHIVIFGSAKSDGITRQVVADVFKEHQHRFVDLRSLNIKHFDYEEDNSHDDFIPLMEELVQYDSIILASPVYWYALSSYMKVFIDRWADLLGSRKDLSLRLERKRLFVISSFGTDFPLGCASFESPIRQTCNYMNIDYGGAYYHPPDSSYVRSFGFPSIEEFRTKLFDPKADLELRIRGPRLSLRLANLSDREAVYRWSSTSKKNWQTFYFQRPLTSRGHVFIIELGEREIGAVVFHQPDLKFKSKVEIFLSPGLESKQGLEVEVSTITHAFLHREFGIL